MRLRTAAAAAHAAMACMQRERGIVAPPHALEAAAELLAHAPPQVRGDAMALLLLVLNEVRCEVARLVMPLALTRHIAAVASRNRVFTIVITGNAAVTREWLRRHRHALLLGPAA